MLSMLKRVFLFGIVNILVILMITIVLRILGLDTYLYQHGQLNYQSLLIFCLIWGMGGSFISLMMSKVSAKHMMRVAVIDPNASDPRGQELLRTVHNLAKSAGLSTMPEVGVYPSQEINAFATGPSKNNALVAVSAGLLNRMNKAEVEGVLGHEVSHIANGDMVTMTLIQGVINVFVMFFARIFAFLLTSLLSRGENNQRSSGSFGMNFLFIMVFQMIFGLLGMIVVGYFSRVREYRADAGSARIGGKNNMIAALEALKGTAKLLDNEHESLDTLKISGNTRTSLAALLSTHPSLDDRIDRLKKYAV